MYTMQQYVRESKGQPRDSEEGSEIPRGEIRKIPCEVWSRVVGYLRPLASWNLAKRQEFEDRVNYKMPEEKEVSHDATE